MLSLNEELILSHWYHRLELFPYCKFVNITSLNLSWQVSYWKKKPNRFFPSFQLEF